MVETTKARPAGRRLAIYVVVVDLLGLGALASLRGADFLADTTTLVVLLVLAVLTGYRPVHIGSIRTTVSASDPFLFAAIVLLGGPSAVLIGIASVLSSCAGAGMRFGLRKLLFNVATAIISIVASVSAYQWIAPLNPSAIRSTFPLLAAATVYFLCNTSLIAGAISIDRGLSFFRTWTGSGLWTAATHYFSATLAVGLILLVETTGIIGLALGVPPVWFLLAYFRSHRDKLREQQDHMRIIVEHNEKLEEQVRVRTEQLAHKVDELEQARERLRELANTDDLTQLPNRRRLDLWLTRELQRSQRFNHPMSIMIIDIDKFKLVNDNFGHAMGDLVLQQIGKLLALSVRVTDLAARYGGEEFSIVLAETDLAGACTLAEGIRRSVEELEVGTSGEPGPESVTVSIGVAAFPADGDTEKALLSIADARLYEAKDTGRNRVVSALPAKLTRQ